MNERDKRDFSFQRLLMHPMISMLFELIEIKDASILEKLYESGSDEVQKSILHEAWTIVGHLRLENGPKFYGGSMVRLKKIFKTMYS